MQQRFRVDIMQQRRERVDEEDNRVASVVGDRRAVLRIRALRTALQKRGREPGLVIDTPVRRPGGNEII